MLDSRWSYWTVAGQLLDTYWSYWTVAGKLLGSCWTITGQFLDI